jgi:adenine/guanine/hypoxanthine permease
MVNRFVLHKHQTDWKQELTAGFTVFFTVAYILAVNPLILKDAGIPLSAGILATIAVSVFGCLWMGWWANAPIVLVPGMGVNAFFSYTLVQSIGLSWQQALAAVVLSGVLFFAANVSSFGQRLSIAIPASLKHGITVGIGLFLTLIGLQKGHIVVSSPNTMIRMGDLSQPVVWTTLIGLVVTVWLFVRGIKGSLLIGIAFTTALSLIISGPSGQALPQPGAKDFLTVFATADFSGMIHLSFWIAVFSLSMIVIFENMGLLSGMLPDQDKFSRAFKAAAISSAASGIFGTSPTIAAAESASGIAEGARTGIPALVTAGLFLLSYLFVPLIGWIPENAVAPVLVIIGAMMMQSVRHIPFHEFTEGFPAFLIITLIPFTYSIADGIAFGFIAYPLMKAASGKIREVSGILNGMAVLFLLYFIATSWISH